MFRAGDGNTFCHISTSTFGLLLCETLWGKVPVARVSIFVVSAESQQRQFEGELQRTLIFHGLRIRVHFRVNTSGHVTCIYPYRNTKITLQYIYPFQSLFYPYVSSLRYSKHVLQLTCLQNVESIKSLKSVMDL